MTKKSSKKTETSKSTNKWKNLIGQKMREKKYTGTTLSKAMGMSHKIFYHLMESNTPPASFLLERLCKELNLGENGMKKLIRAHFPEGTKLWTKKYKGNYVYFYPKSQVPKKSKKQSKEDVKKLERILKSASSDKKVLVQY
jgi:hypothetical protein